LIADGTPSPCDAEADHAVAVADDDQRAEAQVFPPLTTFVTR